MCQALCFVFSLHYITDSSQPKKVGSRKPDSEKLRNLSTQQISNMARTGDAWVQGSGS